MSCATQSAMLLHSTADSALRPYTTVDHSGFWRFLVVREGKNTGESMVNLVTADRGEKGQTEVDRLAEILKKEVPEITTIVHSVSKKKAQVATGDSCRTVYGPGYITDRLGDFTYRISANSFFKPIRVVQKNSTSSSMLLPG